MTDLRLPHHQPIEMVDGVARFKANKIIEWLFESGKLSLNETRALPGVPQEDHAQLAQLLGYSVSGYGDLSIAVDVEYHDAQAADIETDSPESE